MFCYKKIFSSVHPGPAYPSAGPFAPAKFLPLPPAGLPPRQNILTPPPPGPPPRQNILTPPPPGPRPRPKIRTPAPAGPRPRPTVPTPPPPGRRPGCPGQCFLGRESFYISFFRFLFTGKTGLFTPTFKGTFHFFHCRIFYSRALSRIFRLLKKTVSWLKFLEFRQI